ncbi:MAG: GntR family transcriptional regulator [Acholeplasma sp.]|nr:GntR family transcriptional regulator [Acholeplasma sp.]
MNILVSLQSNKPIYEQIKSQIVSLILEKELKPFDQLPSIRQLSTTLQVGIITTKRAYEDLVRDGVLISKMGKGYYVSDMKLDSVKSLHTKELISQLKALKPLIQNTGMSLDELQALLRKLMEEA